MAVMCQMVILCIILLCAFFKCVVAFSETSENYNAALCCLRGTACLRKHALHSRCVQGCAMHQQSNSCQRAACQYCAHDATHWLGRVCRATHLRGNCIARRMGRAGLRSVRAASTLAKAKEMAKAAAKATAKAKVAAGESTASANCTFGPVWKGGGKIVVFAAAMAKRRGWTRNADRSITWKSNGRKRLDRKGSAAICVHVRPAISGAYYFTAVTSAHHWHNHNDAWFKFSANVMLYRPRPQSVLRGRTGFWYKGFQNEGKGVWAKHILTIDNNGHQFVLPSMVGGQTYSLCISGRSSKFTLGKFVLIKCPGGITQCTRFKSSMVKSLKSLPPSKCV